MKMFVDIPLPQNESTAAQLRYLSEQVKDIAKLAATFGFHVSGRDTLGSDERIFLNNVQSESGADEGERFLALGEALQSHAEKLISSLQAPTKGDADAVAQSVGIPTAKAGEKRRWIDKATKVLKRVWRATSGRALQLGGVTKAESIKIPTPDSEKFFVTTEKKEPTEKKLKFTVKLIEPDRSRMLCNGDRWLTFKGGVPTWLKVGDSFEAWVIPAKPIRFATHEVVGEIEAIIAG